MEGCRPLGTPAVDRDLAGGDAGLVDILVADDADDADELRGAVRGAISARAASPGSYRSEQLDVLEARLATLDPADPPEPSQLRAMWGDTYDVPSTGKTPRRRGSGSEPHSDAAHSSMQPSERGRRWITALADGTTPRPVIGSVLRAEHGEQQRSYFANTTGRRLLHSPEKVIDDLAQAVQQPVRWYDAVRLMPELGVTATVQVPPGHVLTAIVTRENPSMTNVAVDDTGLATAVRRVTRARES